MTAGPACPQPNQTNAKNPSTATVTPRSRPVGKKLVWWSVTVALRLLTPRHVLMKRPGISGTHREHRVSRAIGFGHGITITTQGSRERDGPEPYGLVVRLLT